jgi:hypothetical protein
MLVKMKRIMKALAIGMTDDVSAKTTWGAKWHSSSIQSNIVHAKVYDKFGAGIADSW